MVIKTEENVSRLWIHEITRVFHDRLIDEKDRDWFYNLTTELLNKHFRGKYDKKELFEDKVIMFSDVFTIDSDKKYYEEITDIEKLARVLVNKLDDYNSDDTNSSKM